MAVAIPEDLKYTKDHEWMRLAGKIATVGITAHAQEQLGDVVEGLGLEDALDEKLLAEGE